MRQRRSGSGLRLQSHGLWPLHSCPGLGSRAARWACGPHDVGTPPAVPLPSSLLLCSTCPGNPGTPPAQPFPPCLKWSVCTSDPRQDRNLEWPRQVFITLKSQFLTQCLTHNRCSKQVSEVEPGLPETLGYLFRSLWGRSSGVTG